MVVKHAIIQGHIKQRPLILAQPKETPYTWQFNSSRAAFIVEFFIFQTCVLSKCVLRKLIGNIASILTRSVSEDLRDVWVKKNKNKKNGPSILAVGEGRSHRDILISLA